MCNSLKRTSGAWLELSAVRKKNTTYQKFELIELDVIKHAVHDNDLFLHMSGNVNEVIRARKVPKAQRRNQAKVKHATREH